MTPEEHRMLIETRELVEENSRVLKNIQRYHRVGAVVKVIYWAIIIGVTFGAFYLIQPYFEMINGSFEGLGDSGSSESFTLGEAVKNLNEIKSLYGE